MKVAIVYDRVNKFGGAERVLLSLHKMFLDAPLYTSVYSSQNAKWAEVFPKIYTSFLQHIPFAKNNHEFFFFLMPLTFSLFDFENYDLVVSVTSEFGKNINVKNGKHICYCLTPTRYLWNPRQIFNFQLSIIDRFPIINFLKRIDFLAAQKPDVMIAISSVVQRRIKKYYSRNSGIIFPPVEFAVNSRFKTSLLPASRSVFENAHVSKIEKNYFLVVSRLVKYKRVDLVIDVFNELGLPLVIVGTGREEKKLRLKNKSKNTVFWGRISDEELYEVYKNAKALIFAQEEDFGIVAVEAQSFGVPVIAYKKGGVLDTVIDGETGVFFDKQTKQDLIKAIGKFSTKKFDTKILRKNAERFSEKRFETEFLQIVKRMC